jgi:hypothetical protein
MGKRNEWNGSFAMNERRRGSEQPTAQSVYLSVKLLAEAESFGPISINPPWFPPVDFLEWSRYCKIPYTVTC